MKFHHKSANLRQVNSSNSQEKFKICCTDMHLVRILVNFAVFCEFRGMSQIYLKFEAPRLHKIPEALTRDVQASNTASHDNREKINLWVLFSFPIWVWGSAWWTAGALL